MKKPASPNAINYSLMAFPKGNVRLSGKDLGELRKACLKRDKGRCRKCGVTVSDSLPAWHPRKYDMAHIRVRNMGGDLLSNVRCLCHECHGREHNKGRNG